MKTPSNVETEVNAKMRKIIKNRRRRNVGRRPKFHMCNRSRRWKRSGWQLPRMTLCVTPAKKQRLSWKDADNFPAMMSYLNPTVRSNFSCCIGVHLALLNYPECPGKPGKVEARP